MPPPGPVTGARGRAVAGAMSKKTTSNPGSQQKQYADLIKGLTAGAPAGVTELGVGGTTFTIPNLIAKLTGYGALYDAVSKAEAALTTAVQAREAAMPQAAVFLQQARSSVRSTLGATSTDNEGYGITPKKVPAPLTVEQLQAKKEKAAATRKARGTMGPKQKASINFVEQLPAVELRAVA